MDDTSPQVKELIYKRLAQLTLSQKAMLFFNLQKSARAFMLAGLKSRYPSADAEELKKRWAALTLGADFTRRYYNWDPDQVGY